MNCKACDYPLWNLKARNCPECGAPFRPGEFEFVANSVRFCCPRCDQSYYGTGQLGHLVPAEFNCVLCGHRVSMDEMVLRPAAGVTDEGTRVSRTPWPHRRQRGFFSAMFGTIGLALVHPPKLIRGLPGVAAPAQAWWFAVIVTLLTWAVQTGPLFLLLAIPMMAGSRGRAWDVVATVAAFVGFGIGVTLAALLLWALSAHLLLMMTGPRHSGLRRTLEAFGYSAGANAITATPCVGVYVGWIWWVISATLLLKEAQRVSPIRAAVAALAFPLLCLIGGTVFIVFGVMLAGVSTVTVAPMGRLSPPPGVSTAMAQETQAVVAALCEMGAANGAYPVHAIELLEAGNLGPADFISVESRTNTADIAVGSIQLNEFESLTVVRRQEAVNRAKALMTPDVAAHRLGDFVFTYHGMKPDLRYGNRWVVILCPTTSDSSSSDGVTWIGLANGSITPCPQGSLDAMLAVENLARQREGLPLLPNPKHVQESAPSAPASSSMNP